MKLLVVLLVLALTLNCVSGQGNPLVCTIEQEKTITANLLNCIPNSLIGTFTYPFPPEITTCIEIEMMSAPLKVGCFPVRLSDLFYISAHILIPECAGPTES
ncbi:hypothetical protein FQA39_LY16897 [Lamprigera yunnana]|nr:hypothetical protein FQA39_LY16897 [Lamprigera yunnana]